MSDKPEIVCLCGSTRFALQFAEQNLRLTLLGKIERKIDLADSVFVVNPGGYIGASTAGEIAYAKMYDKPVAYLVQPGLGEA